MVKYFFILLLFSLLNACKRNPPTKAEMVRELESRGEKITDVEKYSDSLKASKALVEHLSADAGANKEFRYRICHLFDHPKQISISFLSIDIESKELKQACVEVLKSHEIESIKILNEASLDSEDNILKFQAVEYRLIKNQLVSHALGKIRPGMITKMYVAGSEEDPFWNIK